MTTPTERPAVSLRTGHMQALNQSPSALYRLFDKEGRLLYLGIAKNPRERFNQHSGSKFWWHLVARRTIEWYPNRVLAVEAEHAAILDEKPIHDASYRFATGDKYEDMEPPKDPYWRPLALLIYREIEVGIYRPGERLPIAPKSTSRYGVSAVSVASALERLVECKMARRIIHGRYGADPSPNRLPPSAIWAPTNGETYARNRQEERERRAAARPPQ